MNQDRMSPARTIPPTQNVFDADEALRRARTDRVVQPARRTLAEMAPGYLRQPLLRLVPLKASDAPCLFCDRWTCPGDCQQFAPAPATAASVMAVAS
ncbi:hypothetical protein ACF05T_28325 [Streptomyces lateritius]|uniref:Uncharacterized protein n=1 Tax=Streptomyces lateritius TaxID=67313 RepID=A0ABW6YJC9_9ACTN